MLWQRLVKYFQNSTENPTSDGVVFTQPTSAKHIRKHITKIPKDNGVYKQYVTEEGLKFLDGVRPIYWKTVDNQRIGLVYIGKAKSINQRLGWHLGFINTSHSNICSGTISTLRKSYMANHKDIRCLSEQEKLNTFLDKYVYIEYAITPDYMYIEDKLIEEYDVPLNIKGNVHEFIKTNRERRKEMTDAYKIKYKCKK